MLPSHADLIDAVSKNDGIRTRELAAMFECEEDRLDELVAQLMDLQAGGELIRIPEKGWTLPERTHYRVGVLYVTRQGHGYVDLSTEKNPGEFFVPSAAIGTAFHGDLVLVEEVSRPKRRRRRVGKPALREARVVDIVRRRRQLVRGSFRRASAPKGKGSGGFVSPIEKSPSAEVYIAPGLSQDVRDGQKVLVRLLDGRNYGDAPRGEIVHIIEDEGTYESDLQSILVEFGLPIEMPAEALKEAGSLPSTIGKEAVKGREDFRTLTTFTIDPEDARDFDDAVSLERLADGGYRLGVHIADVSHYVRPGSALNQMARERGTSIYFPGRVLPMLPERISNDLASLQPEKDRLAKTVLIDFDSEGVAQGSEVVRSVIRSQRRFTYDEVLAILCRIEGAPAPTDRELLPPSDGEKYESILKEMASLRDLLHRRRLERGALEMEIPTLRLHVDRNGDVLKLAREVSDPSHQLIEEFMLAANEAVALFISSRGLPLVCRVHDEPDRDMLEGFFDFLKNLENRFGKTRHSGDLQQILREVHSEPYAPLVHMQLLRSLSHAEYSDKPGLHYALATSCYCHFTSPIRRYPDLVVHQILDEFIDGRLRSAKRKGRWKEELPHMAAEASQAEKRAEKAEREMNRLRLIRYLMAFLGEEMRGMITSVHPFGFFVQVEEPLFDGLVHVASLGDDYYEYDPANFCLTGQNRLQRFCLGDRVRVVLADLDPDLRAIHLEFVAKCRIP